MKIYNLNETHRKSFMQDFEKYIEQEKIKNPYLEIVFLCVGTDRLIGDCFGPLVGSKLEKMFRQYNIFNISIYGTLDENICYTNIEKTLKKIKKLHKNPCIIVIDAALASEKNIGKIYVKTGNTEIANGIHKRTIKIGDISIKAVVGKNYKTSKHNFLSLQSASLNDIMELSNIVAKGIYDIIKYA